MQSKVCAAGSQWKPEVKNRPPGIHKFYTSNLNEPFAFRLNIRHSARIHCSNKTAQNKFCNIISQNEKLLLLAYLSFRKFYKS